MFATWNRTHVQILGKDCVQLNEGNQALAVFHKPAASVLVRCVIVILMGVNQPERNSNPRRE